MEFKIPHPLKAEHEELHNMLRQATQLSGKTGETAKTVAELMHPHFVKEEEYALPPLGKFVFNSGFDGRIALLEAASFGGTWRISNFVAFFSFQANISTVGSYNTFI